MLIFIEGIDKSGKSTFIKNLSSFTAINVYRKKPPSCIELKDHHNFFKGIGYALIELHDIYGFNAIVDRSFISDWVYTNRDKSVKGFDLWQEWESRINKKNALIIYLEIDQEVFAHRITDDPDDYMALNDYHRFTELYDYYLSNTMLPYVRISGNIPFDSQLQELRKFNQIVGFTAIDIFFES